MEALMRKILLFIKRNILLIILFCIVFVTVISSIPPPHSDRVECDASYTNGDYTICDVWPEGLEEIAEKYRNSTGTPIESTEKPVDVSSYSAVMPVAVGTKWTYEGKRIFYDLTEQKEKEVTIKKVAEVTGIEKDGDNLRVLVQETYTNDPELTDREISYWISESGIASTGNNVVNFPFTKGQTLFNDDPSQERTDGLYADIVKSVDTKVILGKEYRCYDISNNTLGSASFETFCEGVGYVRNYYEHHGTPDEWDYKLVKIDYI